MIGSRTAGIPNDHVVAELAAFPLSTEESLRLSLYRLDPELESTTRTLWREAENAMLRAFPGFSVDEAIAIRDQLWFDAPGLGPQPLHHYLTRLAEFFLERRGAHAVPLPRRSFWRPDGDMPAVARRAWRWMTFALPPDLLLAALGGTGPAAPLRVEVLSPRLANHLRDHGFAEIHLHGAAALDFPLLWTGAMVQIAEPETRSDVFRSPGASCSEGEHLGEWLLRAALGRYLLAVFLAWGGREEGFAAFGRRRLPGLLREGPPDWTFRLLSSCIGDLRAGRLPDRGEGRYSELQALYRQITGVLTRHRLWTLSRKKKGQGAVSLQELHALDPLAEVFSPASGLGPTPEMSLVAASLDYLRRREEPDPAFEQTFWQVVRVRSIFYRYIVQRPMVPGLQWFLRHYERMRHARKPLRAGRLTYAAKSSGWGEGLRSLELRTAPESSVEENLEAVEHAVRDARSLVGEEDFELGVVFHFSRTRGDRSMRGVPPAFERGTHADPQRRAEKKRIQNPTGYRYASYYRQERGKALALAGMIERFPLSLLFVRALDACTDELSIPTWVLAPLFRYVRETAETVCGTLTRRLGETVPPLRMTTHTGEDVPHLLTGLRAVEESIRRFHIRAGDRVGHAIALGLDPMEWARKSGQVPVRREVRLFDLAWEWACLAREGRTANGGVLQQIEREVARLSSELFRAPLSPLDIERLVDDLHDEGELRAVGYCDGPYPDVEPGSPRGRLVRYLTDPELFERGQMVEWVDPTIEAPVLADIQVSIRRNLAEQGIAVEVNPSSNLLVGDFTDLTRHPLWRLNPPRQSVDMPPVSVCIGSDDPMTFATCLTEEYQFVFDALLLAGLSDEEALGWVDRARRAGLEHRFTLRVPGRFLDSELLRSFHLPAGDRVEVPFPP